MARFYFDTDDGSAPDTDDEGVDFPDPEAAKHAAKSILAIMIGEKLSTSDHIGLRVVIRDEAGVPIYTACLYLDGTDAEALSLGTSACA